MSDDEKVLGRSWLRWVIDLTIVGVFFTAILGVVQIIDTFVR